MLDKSCETTRGGELRLRPVASCESSFQQLVDLRDRYQRELKVKTASSAVGGTKDRTGSGIIGLKIDKGMFSAGARSPQKSGARAGLLSATETEDHYIRDMFDSFDDDGGGTLSRDEIGKLTLNLLGRELIDEELDAAMLEMDPNLVDGIHFDEFSHVREAASCCL